MQPWKAADVPLKVGIGPSKTSPEPLLVDQLDRLYHVSIRHAYLTPGTIGLDFCRHDPDSRAGGSATASRRTTRRSTPPRRQAGSVPRGHQKARRRLAGQIRALEAGIGLVRSGGQPAGTQLASGTIADAIEALLRMSGEMRAIELTEALQNMGKLLRTDSAYATLHKTLARDSRFARVPNRRGYWRLARAPAS